jgi:hypothetical protein
MRLFLRPTAARFGSLRCCALLGLLALGFLASAAPAAADVIGGTYRGAGTGQSVLFNRHDSDRYAWAGTLRFGLDSGEEVLVFCIQLDQGARRDVRYKGEYGVEDLPNGCQIRYVLDNYPGSTVDSEAEGAARQMAVWHFSDGVDLDKINDVNANVRERSLQIADEAETGTCPRRRTEPPQLRVEPASATVATGRRLAYTVTAGPADANQPITATLTGPAVFDDGRQAASAVLDGNGVATLGVTSTADGNSSLTVFLPYRLEAGIVFSEADSSEPTQRLVMAQHLDGVAQAGAQAVWNTEATATAPAPTDTATRPADTSTPATTPTVIRPTETAAAPTATAAAPASATATGSASSKKTAQPAAPTGAPAVPAAMPKTGGRAPGVWLLTIIGALLLVAGGLAKRREARL